MAKRAGFLGYVKKAFVNHWNLLALGGAVVAGALSGHADIVLPLIAAGEIAYLGGLASNRKFQAYVDAGEHKEERKQIEGDALQRIYSGLDPRRRVRFEELRRRCRELNALAKGVQDRSHLGEGEEMHMEGINRLLWVFLRLLYTQTSLDRFLHSTDEHEIRESLARAEERIAALGPAEEDTSAEIKMRRTLEDTRQSAAARLDNYAKAQQNHQYVQLELERIEAKISGIAEMAINRQDPNFITSEVDGVAATMEQTEEAMSELQFLTGLESDDVMPPSFVEEVEKLEA